MSHQFTPKQIQNFWDRVEKGDDPDACWGWNGRTTTHGYAIVPMGKRLAYMIGSRFSLVLHGFPKPKGMKALHTCDNPPCCNPLHLFWGTQKDNVDDMIAKGRDGCLKVNKVFHYGDEHWSRTNPEKLARGSKANMSSITDDDVRVMRIEYAEGKVRGPELARRYGVSRPAIYNILHRRTWRHVE